jgi:hypothetical protein
MDDADPDGFLCPLTLDWLEDPVFTVDGQTYERKNIQDWFDRGNVTSPLTGKRLLRNGLIDVTLTPNLALKKAIEHWAKLQHNFQSSINISELRINTGKQAWENMTDAEQLASPLYSQVGRVPINQRKLAEIGVGKDKSVYRGFWKGLNVAILHMRRGSCETEARIFSLLGRHSHLVTFYGMAEDAQDGSQSLVTELVPLGSIDEIMDRNVEALCALTAEAKQSLFVEILSQVEFYRRMKYSSRM